MTAGDRLCTSRAVTGVANDHSSGSPEFLRLRDLVAKSVTTPIRNRPRHRDRSAFPSSAAHQPRRSRQGRLRGRGAKRSASVACACRVAFSNCDRTTMPQTGTRYPPTFLLPMLPRLPCDGPTAITLDNCACGRIFCFARWVPGPGRLTKPASDPRSPQSRA